MSEWICFVCEMEIIYVWREKCWIKKNIKYEKKNEKWKMFEIMWNDDKNELITW